jgi:glutamate dehydrogenase
MTTLMERTGLGAVDVVRAYTITEAAYGLRDIWDQIEALDNKVPAAVQMEMLSEVARMLERSVLWILRHCATPINMAKQIDFLKPGVDALRKVLSNVWSDEVAGYVQRQADAYQKKGVPAKLAMDVASLYRLAAANDIATIAAATKQSVSDAAKLYYLVGERFGLGALRARTEGFATVSHWDKLAVSAAIEELFAQQRGIAQKIIAAAKGKASGVKALEAWIDGNKARIERFDQVLAEVKATDALSLSMLTVANRQLSAMTAG